ncbi:MarR family winged helix-turn-helix transcriptional regulator [Corynebacterium accolens]|uniref:MarR family winged helix-turn-helix transcriptional regulator n=1 Tax=Corynebacterium accolens TaxID=38284 RepID=UPI00254D3945|nr:MarR family winged helix-turn-helix transcriptional regulator [Corynebacterium accolens]MDK8711314.1 MarR family winged helix-turn-helix transcriptional regulator [Corynebacterium accolens]MDK8784424.1 MarR family winged helix-turn-helix transcriptional regulator [Corynebacterium accolens]
MRAEESAAWADFVAMQRALHKELANALQAAANVSEADYAVLAVLQRRRGQSTRPHELAAELGWEKSRLHRQLVRMEGRKLVTRRHAEELGPRAIEVTVTKIGEGAFAAALGSHTAKVEEKVVSVLTEEELRQLGSISRKTTRHLAGGA